MASVLPENVLYSLATNLSPTASLIFFVREAIFPFLPRAVFSSTSSFIFCLSFLSISCAFSDNV